MGARERNVRSPRLRFGPPQWLVEALIGFVVISAAFAPFPDEELRPQSALEIGLALAPIAAIPLRLLWPRVALALMALLMVSAQILQFPSPGVVLGLAVTTFAVAARYQRRTSLPVIGVVLVVTVTTGALVAGGVNVGDLAPLAVTVAFAAALGDATRSRREYLESLTDRALKAEETRDALAHAKVVEERLRIARDLHDVVAHQISVISLNAGVASTALRDAPPAVSESLRTIRHACRTVLSEISGLLSVLRDEETSSFEGPRPQATIGQLSGLVDSLASDGVEIVLRIEGNTSRLPAATDLVAYRIVQEGLTNAVKYGDGQRIYLRVIVGDADVKILVSNPVGLGPDSGSLSGGFGLIGLKERALSVRGDVSATRVGDQFRLEARLPIPIGDER